MKSIIFAAGLGTRIQQISKGKPKALVEIQNKTLLQIAVEFLSKNGIEEVIVNIHHQSEMMKEFIEKINFPIPVSISDESNLLLDTGGGLLKARDFFSGENHFLAFNVDVISNININKMLKAHIESKALATLAVRDRSTSRYLLFDNQNKMVGWGNIQTKEQILHKEGIYNQLAFSGIHILSTKIFDFLEQEERENFSITQSYIQLSKDNVIRGYIHNQDYWFDVGKPESYKAAQDFMSQL